MNKKKSQKTWNDNFFRSLQPLIESEESDSEEETDTDNSVDEHFEENSVHEIIENQNFVTDNLKQSNFELDIPNLTNNETENSSTTSQDWVLSEELAFLDKLIRETYPNRIKALQFLKSMLKSNNVSAYFDEEDRQWVEEDLAKQMEELRKLNQIWKETTSVYQNTLLKLATTIETRQTILSYADEKTNVFSQRPQLVEHFAKKQADLTDLMNQCKEKMRQEQQEVRDRLAKENADELAILNELNETIPIGDQYDDHPRISNSQKHDHSGSKDITNTIANVKRLVEENNTTNTNTKTKKNSKAKSKQKHKKMQKRTR